MFSTKIATDQSELSISWPILSSITDTFLLWSYKLKD